LLVEGFVDMAETWYERCTALGATAAEEAVSFAPMPNAGFLRV
jgi:hypothetical protein